MAVTTHRPERLAELILDILARLVREELRDPRIGFVTLTGVRVSADLRHARVFVSRLGVAAERAASVAALNGAAPFLRRALALQARLRRTPDLAFVEDTSLETGFRVDHLLEEIEKDRPAAPDDGDGAGPGESE